MSAPDYEQTHGYIRHRYRQLEGGAYAKYISHAPTVPFGHTEVSVGTTPETLPSIPQACRRVVLLSIDEDMTFCDDGTDPSATHGIVIPAGTIFVYDTDPDENFKMWCPAPSDVRIAYYG